MNLLLYTLVAYVVNGSCTLAALLPQHPLDGGLKWRGKRLLGDGKTLEGILIGFNSGLFVAILLGLDFRVSVAVIAASLAGDLVGSFIKRRMGLKRGQEVPLMDQLGFIIMAYLTLSFFVKFNKLLALVLVGFTYLIHRLTNLLAYALRLKKVPW